MLGAFDDIPAEEVGEQFIEASLGLAEWDLSTIADPDDPRTGTMSLLKADPITLLNLLKLNHAISDRGAVSILELLKLNLDFSAVSQTEITKPDELGPQITERLFCRSCATEITTEVCVNQW